MTTQEDDNDTGNEVLIELEGSEPQAKETRVSDDGDDDELSSYSHKVKARINRLTERMRKEQRDKDEATRVAQTLLQENQQLRGRVQALDTGYLSEYGARLETQELAVKNAYRAAHESGDADAMLAAQEDIARIALEKQRYSAAKQRVQTNTEQQTQQERPVQPAPRQVQQAEAPKPDPKAQGWAEKNKWFGEDRMLTTGAMAIHQTLVEDEGFDPNSDDYYTEIDRRIRAEFPHKFAARKPGGGSQVAPAGSSASRSTTQERRTVRLTPSQVAIAKRLNVPLEEYAKYVKD